MRLTKVHLYRMGDRGYYDTEVLHTGETGDVLTTEWYERPVSVIAVLTVAIGILGLVLQRSPDLSWASLAYGVLNIVLTAYESVISNQAVIPDPISPPEETKNPVLY